ncbi:MAG: phenylacetaldehyde dehydrogenase [Mycobacterium sp.]|jgi:acyl-CoA reductase-like NAD-dependent aldehyde dehydrogenase|nr:phenylacetaldehyde dehydrogenase [Mycobacterium sp.]MDT7757381.1 phenylacetaldehyde dehydrogenase [Mycobacterium sp.]
MANDTTYGLAATAWTTNLSRAHRLAKRLQSGWGHEVGREGVDAYMKTKSVWLSSDVGSTPASER